MVKSIITFFFYYFRCLAAQAQVKDKVAVATDDKKSNLSFIHNLFKGEVQATQVFPYPGE